MAVFKLSSDKHFIRNFKGKPSAIRVFEYLDDPNVFDMIRTKDSRWTELATVAPDSATFNALEVQGVTIRSDQLTQLANDLILTDGGGQTFHLVVNRQGLCFLYVNSPSSIMRLRISDYFGWSKYGVNVGQASVVWDRWDMSSGAVLVSASNEDSLKKLVEMKDKALEGKDRELAALKLAMKALVNDM